MNDVPTRHCRTAAEIGMKGNRSFCCSDSLLASLFSGAKVLSLWKLNLACGRSMHSKVSREFCYTIVLEAIFSSNFYSRQKRAQ